MIFPDLIVKGDSISIRSQRSIFTDKGEVGRIIEITFCDTGRFYTPQYQISILENVLKNLDGWQYRRLKMIW